MIALSDYSNSELEEMGFPPPCQCLAAYREIDSSTNEVYDVCPDCGTSAPLGRRVSAWS